MRPTIAALDALKAHALGVLSQRRNFDFLLAQTPEQQANLSALKSGQAVTVITGQQAGLFLGPNFTLLKILSAIELSTQLSASLGLRVVPLFWCQSEDHDDEEISDATFLSPQAQLVTTKVAFEGPAKASIAYRALGSDVATARNTCESLFQNFTAGEPFRALLGEHYKPGVSPSRAFCAVLQELFGSTGLLILDPLDSQVRSAFAKAAKPVLLTAFAERARIETDLERADAAIRSRGEMPQVQYKKRSPLFFVNTPALARVRITEQEGGCFTSPEGLSLSESEIIQRIATDPFSFSTSALLRPLVQDSILPTIAYIGGEAELRYHRQIDELYKYFSIQPPAIIERAHVRLIDERCSRLLTEMELSPRELERPTEDLLREIVSPKEAQQLTLLREAALTPVFQRYREEILPVAPTLEKPIRKGEEQVSEIFRSLEGKYEKALLEREGVTKKRLETLQNTLFPRNAPQERTISAASFLARYGTEVFEKIREALRPFSSEWKDVYLG